MNYGPFMGSPYYSMMPAVNRGGFFSRLFSGINFGSILTNTQKTLGIVNQALPVIKQVQPVLRNAKTMFKVMNEFKRDDSNISLNKTTNVSKQTQEPEEIVKTKNYDGPTFFM